MKNEEYAYMCVGLFAILYIFFNILGLGNEIETIKQDPVSAVQELDNNYKVCLEEKEELNKDINYWKNNECEKELNKRKSYFSPFNAISLALLMFFFGGGLTFLIIQWGYDLNRRKK